MSEFAVMVRQLSVMVPKKPVPPFNPRPAGLAQPGCTTDAVIRYLAESPGFRTHAQIMFATGRSHSAVSWALIRLRKWGMVMAVGDVRNVRYLRYRVIERAV